MRQAEFFILFSSICGYCFLFLLGKMAKIRNSVYSEFWLNIAIFASSVRSREGGIRLFVQSIGLDFG